MTPWCQCRGANTCIGCMIEEDVRARFGGEGVLYLREHLVPSETLPIADDFLDGQRYRYLRGRHCGRAALDLGDDEDCWLDLDPRDLDIAIDESLKLNAAPQSRVRTAKEIVAARDLEWVKAIHDACSNVSPADPQGKPIDPADIKRCVDAHVRIRLQFLSV